MHDGAGDVGVARAGAAFAARREELGISQRELAKQKIISAPSLIDFEKGRSWPRERTRAKLEKVVFWPPGTLAKLSAGAAPPRARQAETARGANDPAETDEVLLSAVSLAAGPILARTGDLPDDSDPRFAEQATALLADLRTLETLALRTVRSSRGAPQVIRLLREIRLAYRALMTRAAAAPGATLGQRLYVARTSAALSVGEAAAVLDMEPEVLSAAESERPISEQQRQRVERWIADIGG